MFQTDLKEPGNVEPKCDGHRLSLQEIATVNAISQPADLIFFSEREGQAPAWCLEI